MAPVEVSKIRRVRRGVLEAIFDGVYGPGARLPAERELAAQMGVSRVCVREAVQRLVHWGVVEIRQGSGATVLPVERWNGGVLAPVLRYRLAQRDWSKLVPVVRDAFGMRRGLLMEFLGRAAAVLQPGDLHEARQRIDEAWAKRKNPAAFIHKDREVIPAVLRQARMLPSLWTLNTMADSYLAVMEVVGDELRVPDNYLSAHLGMCEALENGRREVAKAKFGSYLNELDRNILTSLPAGLLEKLTERDWR
jgi:DNA-binding FadR family transcriptional regulator